MLGSSCAFVVASPMELNCGPGNACGLKRFECKHLHLYAHSVTTLILSIYFYPRRRRSNCTAAQIDLLRSLCHSVYVKVCGYVCVGVYVSTIKRKFLIDKT